MTNIITESHNSPLYFQHLLVPISYPICKTMLINQVLVDSVLRTNYLTLLLTLLLTIRHNRNNKSWIIAWAIIKSENNKS
jgi:hypothetical protein